MFQQASELLPIFYQSFFLPSQAEIRVTNLIDQLLENMKNRPSKDDSEKNGKAIGARSRNIKKNVTRLGGRGLSLEAFANAKSTTNHYNPALIKKQREFYKNAKYVSKFKRKTKHQNQQNDISSAVRLPEDENETAEAGKMIKRDKKKHKGSHSLRGLYEKQREEKEKARIEREEIIRKKKEEREKAEARRKAERQKMFKKTRSGQPVMKYKIEHLLETIQGSN